MPAGLREAAYILGTRSNLSQLQFQFFEELPLGGEWSTRRRTISEADVALFNGLVGDYSPLVADAEYAAGSHFGGRVASGPLLVAAAIGLGSIDVPPAHSAGLVGTTWRFLKPVRAGDTIETVWRLARKRPVENPRWGLAVWQVAVRNQDGETCAEGEVARLVVRREQPAAPGRRRRRRRSGAAVVTETPAPEPAPVDTPPPRRRRRQEQPAETSAEAGPAPAPSRRRRRRRGNGGRAANGGEGSEQQAVSTNPAPASNPQQGGIGSVLRRIRRRR